MIFFQQQCQSVKIVVYSEKDPQKPDSRPVDPTARETPSAGKELGFMEQLIGNLGKFNANSAATKAFKRTGGSGGAGGT